MTHVPSWVVQSTSVEYSESFNRSTSALNSDTSVENGVSTAVQAAADSKEVSVALYLSR